MGLIKVEGIRVYAFHGCLPEEAKIGGNYIVNVWANADFTVAEQSDALDDTIDYGRVTAIVEEQMAIRSKLIEHVAERILQHLMKEWDHATWELEVVKLRPPINGNVDRVSYTVKS